MKIRSICWTAFPLAVLASMALERMAAFLLNQFPSSLPLWMISGELRTIFRTEATLLESAVGHALSLQILILSAVAAMTLIALRAPRTNIVFFALNHVFLFAILLCMAADGAPMVASLGDYSFLNSAWHFGLSLQPTPLKLFMIGIGLIACSHAHVRVLWPDTMRSYSLSRRR